MPQALDLDVVPSDMNDAVELGERGDSLFLPPGAMIDSAGGFHGHPPRYCRIIRIGSDAQLDASIRRRLKYTPNWAPASWPTRAIHTASSRCHISGFYDTISHVCRRPRRGSSSPKKPSLLRPSPLPDLWFRVSGSALWLGNLQSPSPAKSARAQQVSKANCAGLLVPFAVDRSM
jgi:hypothetical protein